MVASSVAEGQYFLDTSTDTKRQAIAAIMYEWIDECVLKRGLDILQSLCP
jgi:hypothetical protein